MKKENEPSYLKRLKSKPSNRKVGQTFILPASSRGLMKDMEKKILLVDMDNVLVNFQSSFDKVPPDILKKFDKDKDEIPGIFSLMEPMPDAIESFIILSKKFDTYILSTSPWNSPDAASHKVDWVKKYLGDHAYKRLILSHHKHLNKGDFLIDDRHDKNGADKFEGELIHFGSPKFPNWITVREYLLSKVK